MVVVCVCVCESAYAGQMSMPAHDEQIEQTPPDRLPPPRELSGIGNAHIAITAKPESQRWFDQGLNLYHDFWDYEAARAFQQSIRIDPQCAMCYWGLYKAESFFHSNAQGYAAAALDQALRLQELATERERLYIRATSADMRDAPVLWRTLIERYPDDLQAQIFASQSGGGENPVAMLERVLKADPNNSAANHYYIHMLEAGAHPERALRSAELLPKLAPASGHMVHMPGHIYFRVGEYARAEKAFTASERVDEQYMRRQHVDPDDDWNYVHNLMYAVANFMEEGKFDAADNVSMKLTGARGRLPSATYAYSTRDSISRLNPRLPVALRTADWQRVLLLLSASPPRRDRPTLGFLAAQLEQFASGMRAIESGDVTNALQYATTLDAALAQKKQPSSAGGHATPAPPSSGAPTLQVEPDALLLPILSSLSIMALELRGALLSARGEADESRAAFEQAEIEQRALGYREPPIYIRPVYEAQVAALVAAGKWKEARRAYEQALTERPRSGFGLYGIALTSERTGDRAAAVREYRAFLVAWNHADRRLPQIVHAREFIAGRQ